jgi:SAM-dependent methyltransferase
MWWFHATHNNLLLLHRLMRKGSAAGRVLDAGCGTGGLLARIAAEYPEHNVIGLDADRFACVRAAAKSHTAVCTGSVNELPFADASFAAIFSADVMCHDGVNEVPTLAEFRRCLSDNGVLILNLPAYPWLLSRHDRAVANVRRYTRLGLTRLLQAAGFRLLFASYWNAFLLPVMVMTRKLLPERSEPASDVHLYPAPVEALCRAATGLETFLLRRGVHFPFGGSLIAVAAKQHPIEANYA